MTRKSLLATQLTTFKPNFIIEKKKKFKPQVKQFLKLENKNELELSLWNGFDLL